MRELRPDEIELIERVRNRDTPIVLAVKKLTLATKRMREGDKVGESGLYEFPGLLEINDHPLFHPISPRCRCTLVPMEIINEPVHREPSKTIPVPKENNPWFCPECGSEFLGCCKKHIIRLYHQDTADICPECGRPMKRTKNVVICEDCLLAYEKPQDTPGEGEMIFNYLVEVGLPSLAEEVKTVLKKRRGKC